MMRWTLSLLVLTSTAWADVSVSHSAADFDPLRCTMADGPMQRASLADDIQKLIPPRRMLRSVGRGSLLLVGTENGKGANLIERASGKEVLRFAVGRNLAAVVEDSAGKLRGALSLYSEPGPTNIKLMTADGTEPWAKMPALEQSADAATALVVGKLLVVASFHRIASGAHLAAFDLQTGTPKWKADVLQLNVAHSKYWNDVSLEQRAETVVMRGYEAGGCYEQTFDVATGKRLSAVMPTPNNQL